jgi:hypothetical protein
MTLISISAVHAVPLMAAIGSNVIASARKKIPKTDSPSFLNDMIPASFSAAATTGVAFIDDRLTLKAQELGVLVCLTSSSLSMYPF